MTHTRDHILTVKQSLCERFVRSARACVEAGEQGLNPTLHIVALSMGFIDMGVGVDAGWDDLVSAEVGGLVGHQTTVAQMAEGSTIVTAEAVEAHTLHGRIKGLQV